jgi:hypothetical protein
MARPPEILRKHSTALKRAQPYQFMIFKLNAFDKAKTQVTLTATLVFVAALTGFLACKKDIGQDTENARNVAVQDRSDAVPSAINGILQFSSFADLQTFAKSLQDREADTAQVRAAYTSLGVNVNAETLPNLTDHPVCLLQEQTIGGYTSARKSEENTINTTLNNGDDNVISIVHDPYWKTVLNADRAVKVGNRIYKFFENDGVAIVLNNDWTLYNTVKTQAWDALPRAYNLVITHRSGSDFEDYVTLASNGDITSDKAINKPRFNTQTGNDGKQTITNVSCVASAGSSPSYLWTYSDNSTSSGRDPNRTVSAGEALTVTINDGAGNVQTLNANAMFICDVTNFAITPLGNNVFKFGPAFDPSNSPYHTKWVFSDGTTQNGSVVTKTFTSNGWARCEVYWDSSDELACQATKPVIIKCGDKRTHSESHTFNQSGQNWKLDGSIWVKIGEVGCRVKYLKKVAGLWVPANNQGACADLGGIYIREVQTPFKDCKDIEAEAVKCLGNGTFPTSVSATIPEVSTVFNKPGQLNAGLRIKVNGTWRGWGSAGKPRLVLP